MNTKQLLLDKLNAQVAMEFSASNKYLDIATRLDVRGYRGAAKFFYAQAEEERVHAMKISDYLIERDESPEYGVMIQVDTSKGITLKTAFEKALKSEQEVTKSIEELVALAHDNKDYTTVEFLQFFLSEQREEEDTMKTILDKIKIIGDDKAGIYLLDSELESGAFRDEETNQ